MFIIKKEKQKRERKLSNSEIARKEIFEETKARLESDGYKEHPLTIGVWYANIMALVIGVPITVVLTVIFYQVNSITTITVFSPIMLFVVLLLIVAHELIHGFVWGVFAKHHFKSISFGFILQALTPYCTCNEPLKKRHYIVGSAMPTIILGLLPAFIAILNSSDTLFFISVIMIIAGGGDLIIMIKLLRYSEKGKKVIYLDHPYECGLMAFEKST